MFDQSDRQASLVKQCELLQVSYSCLYYQPVSESQKPNHHTILEDQHFSILFYGVERLVSLVVVGYGINCKRLRNLMILMADKPCIIHPAPPKQPLQLTNILLA